MSLRLKATKKEHQALGYFFDNQTHKKSLMLTIQYYTAIPDCNGKKLHPALLSPFLNFILNKPSAIPAFRAETIREYHN